MQRTVLKVLTAKPQQEGVGAIVKRSIGSSQLRHLDPFLLLDEFHVQAPAGFPDHPHRGFETVTFMLEGAVEHEDFTGRKGVIGPGDLQWMTAGKGIVHAEMPVPGQLCKGIQLWVNLPKKYKMVEPKYQEWPSEKVPVYKSQGVLIKVIAGQVFDIKANISTMTPILYLDIQLEANQSVDVPIPSHYNALIHTIQGMGYLSQEKQSMDASHTFILSNQGELVHIETKDSNLHLVLIAGEPINEPVVQHGPFVMNSEQEIYDAFMDYQMSQNGYEKAKQWKSEIAKSSSP